MKLQKGHKFNFLTFKDSNETQGDVTAIIVLVRATILNYAPRCFHRKTLKNVINALDENVFQIIHEMWANILSLKATQMLREFHSSTVLFACRAATLYECFACMLASRREKKRFWDKLITTQSDWWHHAASCL